MVSLDKRSVYFLLYLTSHSLSISRLRRAGAASVGRAGRGELQQLGEVGGAEAGDGVPAGRGVEGCERNDGRAVGRATEAGVAITAARAANLDVVEAFAVEAVDPRVEETQQRLALAQAGVVEQSNESGEGCNDKCCKLHLVV